MNETPRVANRILLALFGLVLLAAGALAVALSAFPGFASWWQGWAGPLVKQLREVAANTAISGQNSSLIWIGVAVVLVLLIIGMIAWVANQGRGRTTILAAADDQGEADGLVSINGSVAEQLLRQALNERPELLGATVTTYEVKGEPGLKIRVLPRQGVAPHKVAAEVSELVGALDELLGQRTPVLLSIGSGTRARFTKAERVH
ncbi:hypothetical protein RSal33209_3087 [Renibacterium salmoninarum ATCC 33209]|uniref:Alkaline shock response membrane anchor protein AmaP n=1 Tax=Renibacterium salmoninarum (strain ATCC 33209 / DSM 20767 / JCM 11484 / NBRC 15589 / NCIMB 2235) TaxID=288705 RepID=A9WUD7_RENSM|nr:hypothetical protein [Renibacterium salmoninarum]ABY24808.1 hypothetical protein RSal33209_3087 [Renibacterium salmoninarum ATCC 33209]